MTNEVGAAELKAAVVGQNAQQIELRYQVRNVSKDRIYVFTPMLRYGPKSVIKRDDEGAHVFLQGNHTARLLRGLIAPPLYMSVARRPPIVVTAVEADASHVATIRLALPLVEANPYFPPQECDLRSAHSISELKLQVGWVEARTGMALGEVSVDGAKLLRLSGGWGAPLQRVLETVVPVTGVALCPYAGQFDRPALTQ